MDKVEQVKASSLYTISLRRRLTKNILELILLSMTIIILLPLFSILYDILSQGLPVFLNVPNFLSNNTAGPTYINGTGMGNALLGSIVITFAACIFAIPVGILAGIYLAQSNSNGISYTSTVRLIADVLQSTPSIVAGLVIYFFWVIPNGTEGTGAFAGGLSLGILMLPIVSRVTEEGIRTVPTSINEAALSLGIPEWRIMLTIILRSASSIVLTGIMLGIARITGETAPLIFTTGDSNFGWGWGSYTPTLTIKIYHYATSPFAKTWVPAGWAMATALLVMVFGINILIRTSIMDYVWKNDLLKMLFTEFIAIGTMLSVLILFGNVVLVLTLGLFLRFLLLYVLSNRDKLDEILDYKIGVIPAGLIAVTIFVLEMVAEILLFLMNTFTNYLYVINYRLFQVFIIGAGIYYLYNFSKQKPKLQRILKVAIGFVFLLILLEVAAFDFGGTNYYLGNVIYLMLLVGILFRLFIYNIVAGTKEKIQKLWSNTITRILVILEILEVSIQILLFSLSFLLNTLLKQNIYLFTNYVYVINFDISLVLIGVLIVYFGYKFFKNQKSNSNRVQNLLLIFGFLFIANFILPLANELFGQILFGLVLKTLIIFIVLNNPTFSKIRETKYSKGVLILVIGETLFELVMFSLNISVDFMTSFVFNLNYVLVIILAIYFVYSLLIHYKIIKPTVNTHV